jgi:hypothetical protein
MIEPTDNVYPIFGGDGRYNPHEAGLTKREYFAALAMQSLIVANPDHNTTAVAVQAVEFANALCKELNFPL